jgi:pimeloyl-ACP methyl ester carboxylesterase
MTGTGRADWARLLPHLEPSFRCVVPDLRGHGLSDFRQADFSYSAMRDDVVALIEQEGLERPHLVGFSMGAEVLLNLELAHPGTAASLVLVGASTGSPPDRAGFGEDVGEVVHWPNGLKRLHEAKHGKEHWRTIFRLVAGTWTDRPELSDDVLSGLRCPTLIVQGADEFAFKRRQAGQIVAAAANARRVEVPGADHPVHLQKATVVNALIRDFLLETEASRV